ncbi:MAG: TetR family transcriptional regulator [Thermoleophilia bacterium]|nr:TetR family transcriptional regulator [Thermoleophilia bacterium]
MQFLRIAELEEQSGFPRSAIYHYQRLGLLPPVHRSGGSPAIYGPAHLQALREIRALKEAGLSLNEIHSRLKAARESAREESRELAARQSEATRRRILEAAARCFASKGYRGARLTDIVAKAGISLNTFYRHFAGKRELFVQVVENLIERALARAEPEIAAEPDFAKRHLIRASSFLSLRNISPEMLTFVRAEFLGADAETRNLFLRIYQELARYMMNDLRELRALAPVPPRASDEMMAYALLGVKEDSAMRLSWDQDYTVEDYLWTNLEMILAVQSVYLGPIDIAREREKYASFVAELAAKPYFVFGLPPEENAGGSA